MSVILNKFIILMLLVAQGSLAQNIEKQEWGKFIDAKHVAIDNPIGDVRLRSAGDDNKIFIIAMVQHNERIGKIEIKEQIKDDTYVLSLVRKDDSGEVIALNQDDPSRVDFTVYVPVEKTVAVKTGSGLIEAKKMKSPIDLSSISGDIHLRDNFSRITASTDRGSISANLHSKIHDHPLKFSTLSGDIGIWLTNKSPRDVVLATSGDIISDFSTHMTQKPMEEPNKTARVKVAGGGVSISAISKIGSVALKANPVTKKQSINHN